MKGHLVISGTEGATLTGSGGDDFFDSRGGLSHADGAGGNDTLIGSNALDTLHGGDGNDILDGAGAVLSSGAPSNLFGDAGDDILVTGSAPVIMEGGSGADLFRIVSNGGGIDNIRDFTPGIDKVEILQNINGSGIFTPEDILARLKTGGGVGLDLGHGGFLNFDNLTSKGQLHAEDFRIVVPPSPEAAQTITLRVSGDHFDGDPQFQVYADGKAVGGPQSVTAVHGSGEWQDMSLSVVSGAEGVHHVEISFVNDAADGQGGGEGHDRNLYIDHIIVNGQPFEGEVAANNASLGYDFVDPNAAVMVTNGTIGIHTGNGDYHFAS
jgi:Ca-dependent carbohydrate-binding module xylan-binding/RTX calcium-binding nonapeptide repeat (4 copies)